MFFVYTKGSLKMDKDLLKYLLLLGWVGLLTAFTIGYVIGHNAALKEMVLK